MLDRTAKMDASANAEVELVLTDAEVEIFSQARAAGDGLRKSFDRWVILGNAVVAARAIANRIGGKRTFQRIMTEQGLEWLHTRGRSSVSHLEMMMKNLPKVLKWRETLGEREKVRWSSPQSVWLRCLRPGNRPAHGPRVTPKPMTVREMLAMPAAEIAMMLHRRCPSKAFALTHALNALADTGSVVKPRSGWAAARERAADESLMIGGSHGNEHNVRRSGGRRRSSATVTLDCAPKLVYDAASAFASCGHAANQGCAAVGHVRTHAAQQTAHWFDQKTSDVARFPASSAGIAAAADDPDVTAHC